VFQGFVKGAFSDAKNGVGYGQYIGLDSESGGGVNGIRVGDGYHNYLVAGFVSCSCTGLLEPGRTVAAATLRLKTSRVYGLNPFTAFSTRLKTDMVRPASAARCCDAFRACQLLNVA
jgi:hypothetical protein